ncbi:MAG: hypothetical protein K5872_19135 [Rhizobiaceae bacterium]|nr:hypothetical protein [Rhizobiaceae bacterium]MCV0408337.1 hypothetical protein [Rhizobiaceae bacterium]
MKPSVAAIASCVLVALCLSTSAAAAQSDGSERSGFENAVHAVILPGTDYAIAPETLTIEAESDSLEELQDAIAAWLSFEFDLPRAHGRAAIAFAPATRMASLRFRDVPSDRWSGTDDILAVYDREARTIYLPEGWTGRTPAELSVLVHEMVHHAQSAGGLTYECPEASEKAAYAAQQRFLSMFGSSLETDFQMDGMTVLVRTRCLY